MDALRLSDPSAVKGCSRGGELLLFVSGAQLERRGFWLDFLTACWASGGLSEHFALASVTGDVPIGTTL